MDAIDAVLKSGDVVAVLGREVTVRLINISASGCLVESSNCLTLGATGSLVLKFDGREYVDDVRIVRCLEFEGSSGGYQMGVEFLWTTAPHEGSLRRIVSRLQASAIRIEPFGSSGRM